MRKLRKGDEVVVITGKDRGKKGVILNVLVDRDRVIVENVNMVKRHTKGNPQQGTPGGIIKKEMPLHISNVAIWNSISGKHDRIGFKKLANGQKVRYFKSNSEVVDL